MPFKYTPDQHAAAMVALERNNGDIQATAHQTGIPDRTLRAWRGSILPYLPPPPPDSRQQVAEVPAFESDLDALAFIRQNILGELSRLSASLQHDAGFSTPYQRALVLSQLMDKLLKLDVHLKPYTSNVEQYRAVLAELLEEGDGDDDDEDSDEDDYEYRPVIDKVGDPQGMSDNLWHDDDDDDDANPPA